jgi:hypothetical protein
MDADLRWVGALPYENGVIEESGFHVDYGPLGGVSFRFG